MARGFWSPDGGDTRRVRRRGDVRGADCQSFRSGSHWRVQQTEDGLGPIEAHLGRMNSPDPTSRLNAALQGRYTIEREIGEGGMAGRTGVA